MSEPVEFVCQRCGILVVCCIPPPPETIYCLQCRFIESIDDEADKAEAAAFIDWINGESETT